MVSGTEPATELVPVWVSKERQDQKRQRFDCILETWHSSMTAAENQLQAICSEGSVEVWELACPWIDNDWEAAMQSLVVLVRRQCATSLESSRDGAMVPIRWK